MSKFVSRQEYEAGIFNLGDCVSFIAPWGERIAGEVVRVYNSRLCYHVEVDGKRYSVRVDGGNQDQVRRQSA